MNTVADGRMDFLRAFRSMRGLRRAGMAMVWCLITVTAIADSEDPVISVDRVVKGIIAADNAGDLERVLAHYAEDAVLIAPSGPDVTGKPNIRMHYRKLFETQTLSIENTIAETLVSGDWAITRGTNAVVATSRADGTRTNSHSKYLMTLRRSAENRWQIVHLIWTTESAGSPTR